ncbi:hypothetical protein [Deinococcus sp. AJ005]|uniref:hypothetical protein n=1 Tax=Deinococcus sp. AJ005 TaxID=2652443 RepID=UPI00125CC780|nr:hypothetical protein [Deinococcus sp. AJ005]QFP75534.1 hypothetical protein DAAJ005_02960 [Deinococcus sp. AJ005]
MQHVILFGGGDGGGLIITADGVRRIPPWTPEIRHMLEGVNALSRLKMEGASALAEKLLSSAEKAVEQLTGTLEKGTTVTYLGRGVGQHADFDDGFVCGTPWRRPIPIPGPKALRGFQITPG